MRLPSNPAVHLTYCLNVHPGEGWAECRRAIFTHAIAVREAVGAKGPFGLGLRIADAASRELLEPGRLTELRDELGAAGLYAFTINGFPYGRFHGARVKEDVYRPDWRSPERLAYTIRLARILAALLPDGVDGSISTVPVGFGGDFVAAGDRERAIANLVSVAEALARIELETKRRIRLGLEPEPACVLETCDETIAFFGEIRRRSPEALRHLGVCLDTCHAALAFEDPLETLRRLAAAGVGVSKIQLSAALSARPAVAASDALRRFVEPVYLHQVRARGPGGPSAWLDLPDALGDPRLADAEEARVHFHVPLFWGGSAPLASTRGTMSPAFWAALAAGACAHLEIETYTFDVLPPELRGRGVVGSIAAEYEWALGNLRPGER